MFAVVSFTVSDDTMWNIIIKKPQIASGNCPPSFFSQQN